MNHHIISTIESEDIHHKYEFLYKWKINGFLDLYHVMVHNESHKSKPFSVGPNSEITFQLHYYGKGEPYNESESMSLGLTRISQKHKKMWLTTCSASIMRADGEMESLENDFDVDNVIDKDDPKWLCTTPSLDLWNNVLSLAPNQFLPDNALTIIVRGVVEAWSNAEEPAVEPNHVEERPINTFGCQMWNMVTESLFSDVTLNVKSKTFNCHKAILSVRSPVFRAMFEHDMTENRDNVVAIDDVDEEVFEQMLMVIYTEQCPRISEMAPKLMYPAEKYQLNMLKTKCEEEMRKNMNINNAAEYLLVADKFDSKDLREYAMRFIRQYGSNVMKTQGWKELKEIASATLMGAITEEMLVYKTREKENRTPCLQ